MTGFLEYWNERIRRDLASFGDPGASVDVHGSERRFRASWTMRGESQEATFSVSPDQGAACETPGAFGLAQSSILLVNTHSPWIADWMPALEDRRHAERWK